jgi:NAD(P)-dependent dehydrogenase (short-subunit alcohol dehydrogenase family)
MKDLFDLTAKRAVITGGAGLLGFEHAAALIEKNCSVELWDLSEDGLKKSASRLALEFESPSISYRCVDITVEKEIIDALKVMSEDIDILINNAALNPTFGGNSNLENKSLENYSLVSWNNELSVGLTGAMLCSKHLGAAMAANGKGVILNIASDLSVIAPDHRIYEDPQLAKEVQFRKPVSYSVIKSGLIGLTKYLATYWSAEGVRVNALSPGGVYDNQNPEFVEKLTNLIPLGRMARKEEYRGAIQFLCSDASSYMTGQNLIIDGGRTVW